MRKQDTASIPASSPPSIPTWHIPRIREARVRPLESRFTHCLHAYQGICPWTADGRHLLYLGFEGMDRGWIVLRQLASGEETLLAQTSVLDFHTGAWQRWALGERAVLFNIAGRGGHQYPALVEPRAGAPVRVLDHLPGRQIRELSSEGRRAYTQVMPSQAGYAAVERIDLETGDAKTLLTAEQVMDQVTDEVLDRGKPHHFSHAVNNHDETLMFVKFQPPGPFVREPGQMPRWGIMIVVDLTSGSFWSIGHRSSGHPEWMPNGRELLTIMNPLYDEEHRYFWLVRIDVATGQYERIIDTLIEGPGHPVPSPDGQFFATDAFTPRGDQSPIYLGHPTTGIVKQIARLDHAWGGGGKGMHRITRGQPHPVWSPNGDSLLVNHNHGGDHMQLHLLDGFLEDCQ